ncbi:sodium-coupled neutral amino acid transporter 7-like [Convolutriloba macropyga]|uniref:sodium-coupled neutral amino acid transporter 7-like n=1 Tax=Convolutriloba macropyga TaxID=536237 RepID=UPI003F51F076
MLQIPGILTCISSTSIVILSVFIYIGEKNSNKPETDISEGKSTFLDFAGAVPILVFGLSAHEIQVITYASVCENKLLRHWYKVIWAVFLVAFGLYFFVGSIGYLAFGDQVEDDFLLNCRPDSVVASIARVAVMISITASFV